MPSFLHQLHKRRAVAASTAEFDAVQYLIDNYSLDHWFSNKGFNGATSDGDAITSWKDEVTTSNASVQTTSTNPLLRVVGGRKYASFSEGLVRNCFVLPEATFSGTAMNTTDFTIMMKIAVTNLSTGTTPGVIWQKGKENAFSTPEHRGRCSTIRVDYRSQGTSGATVVCSLDDGDYIIMTNDSTTSRVYTYDTSASTLNFENTFTNGTSSDTGDLFLGGSGNETGGMDADGAKIQISDCLFLEFTTSTTATWEDIIDTVDNYT